MGQASRVATVGGRGNSRDRGGATGRSKTWPGTLMVDGDQGMRLWQGGGRRTEAEWGPPIGGGLSGSVLLRVMGGPFPPLLGSGKTIDASEHSGESPVWRTWTVFPK